MQMNWLELVSALLGLVAVFFNSRGRLAGWVCGAVSVCIYGYIVWQQRLYGQAILQAFYFITTVYGFVQWLRKMEGQGQIKPRHVPAREWGYYAGFFLLACPAVYWLALQLDSPQQPVLDALVTGLSFTAQVMMARRQIEAWLLWMVVNPLTVWLMWRADLYLYAGLYVIIFLLGISGYFHWKKLLNQPPPSSA